jgi:alkanesulfonate monooxygenase SsuD/methylene tetrahydromethanopterin reductase-like flavin-dependent oxidoreductase (luciferase family)
MSQSMAKRVFASVPDTVADELEAWADQQGRSLSNLIGYLLENAVKTAKEKGEIKLRPENQGK